MQSTLATELFQCSICLEQRVSANDREQLSCNHSFCKACIGRWRKSGSTSCPMCRDESHHVRIYLDAENSLSDVLLLSDVQREFGDRICEPLSVCMVNPDTKTMSAQSLLIVPQTLLPELDSLFARHEMRRVQGAPAGAKQHNSAIADANTSTCFILAPVDNSESDNSTANSNGNTRRSISTPMKQLKAQMMQKLFTDQRFAQLQQNNTADVTKSFFPLFCRMLEFELAEQRKWPNQTDIEQACEADTATLQVSNIQRAIVQENLNNPYEILQRFGDDWMRIASKLPRSEVENVSRATKNLAITTKNDQPNESAAPNRETTDNEARSMILWQRFRHPLCACCWRYDQSESLMCCSRCESTLYCSEQCRSIDWPTHSKWCCNPEAKRMRGALELVIGTPDNVPHNYVGSQPAATFAFTPEMVQEALAQRSVD